MSVSLPDGCLMWCHIWVGDRYSIADVALYAYTHVADEGGFNLDSFPKIKLGIVTR